MATQIGQPARSRRFIKLYLSTWALLASGALAYLAVLAYPAPDTEAPTPQARVQLPKSAPAEGPEVMKIRQVKTTEVKSPSEAQGGSLSEVRKDAAPPQEAAGAQPSPNAPGERVAAVDTAQEPPPAAPTTKVPGISLLPVGEPRPSGEAPFKPTDETPAPDQTQAQTPAQTPAAAQTPAPGAAIETGSIPKAEIVFGEPVVTRTGAMAVQLAAAPSLQAARESWEQLSDQHGLLTTLQPRVIAPREEGGTYRLLAGPLSTKADAVRICSQLGMGKACFATQYTGAPL
jgi:sporulation related protein